MIALFILTGLICFVCGAVITCAVIAGGQKGDGEKK
jgi:hypothetical protein